MLNAREFHDLKIALLMDKCKTHGEAEPCDQVCAAVDAAIETVWKWSEMAPHPHELGDEECLVAHPGRRQCRRCRKCAEWVGPDVVGGVCNGSPLIQKR